MGERVGVDVSCVCANSVAIRSTVLFLFVDFFDLGIWGGDSCANFTKLIMRCGNVEMCQVVVVVSGNGGVGVGSSMDLLAAHSSSSAKLTKYKEMERNNDDDGAHNSQSAFCCCSSSLSGSCVTVMVVGSCECGWMDG